MPIRFACPHCQQRLTVSARKAGTEATCPRCHETVAIPAVASAAPAAALPPPGTAAQAGGDDAPPLPRIITFDERPQLIYEIEELDSAPDLAQVDFERVSVPRWVLYSQGGLLGVVALGSFILGIVMGSSFTRSGSADNELNQPCEVSGTILFATNGGKSFPDDGAVIIALPQGEHPDERAPIEGLRPGEAEGLTTRAEQMIQLWRGGMARTDLKGHYRLKLPARGKHFLLVISHHSSRGVGKTPETAAMQQLGRFFEAPAELVGGKSYSWELKYLRGDIKYNKTFD